MRHICLQAVLITSLAACTDKTDADYRADVVASIHDSIGTDLDDLVTAAHNLQAASPSRAWNESTDMMAIANMRDAWKRTRIAYEHIEGAIVALFPGVDAALDSRYDDSIAKLGDGDQDLFDARGVTGMHGIERILFAPTIRPEVIHFESSLRGYKPAAYPATDDEAIEFKTVLVQQLIDKASALRKLWNPAAVDVGTAYRGLVGLMHEAKDKVNAAPDGDEESRYANITLFDLRNNLDGTQKVYNLFRDWIRSKSAGTEYDLALQEKFEELASLYSAVTSDSLPAAPVDWSHDAPTADNLATPFGALWQRVHESVDPNSDHSVVFQMNHIATLLGLPEFVAQ
jgi:iron uptake system component EfeO